MASGIHNAISWFGETAIPKNLLKTLIAWNVKKLIYLPDKDKAGFQSAVKIRDILFGSSIAYDPRALPEALPHKADTNDLWQAVKFNADKFKLAIKNAPPLTLPDMSLKQERKTCNIPWAKEADRGYDHVLLESIEVVPITGFKRDWSNYMPCLFHNHEHDDIRPRAQLNKETGIFYCHKCGESHSLKEVAQVLNITWISRKSRKNKNRKEEKKSLLDEVLPIIPEPFTADQTVDMRYISELDPLPAGSLLIKSPIGTGKTEITNRVIKRMTDELGQKPSILVITHRRALSKNLSKRLGIRNYEQIRQSDYRNIPQLCIVYNSLIHLPSPKEKLPTYDLVIIDEIEQFHNHLRSNTFRGNTDRQAYMVLTQLLKSAGRTLAFDAHCTDISRQWLEEHTGDGITAIENTHTVSRGPLIFHKNYTEIVNKIKSLMHQKGDPIAIATNSKAEAKGLYEYFGNIWGKEDVRLVCGDNTDEKAVYNFLADINDNLSKIKMLIYTPSLGTGFDITCKVRAVIGIFKGAHMNAYDLVQMLGRCRNTQETHVYLQSIHANGSQDWEEIYARHEANGRKTGAYIFDNEGTWMIDALEREILTLLSKLEAKHNRSLSDLLSSFVALLDGYKIVYTDEHGDNDLWETLKGIREKIEAEQKALVLKSKPITEYELEEHRRAKTITPEIRAGYERFLIEDTVGQDIDDELYDNLYQAVQRSHIRRLTDTITDDETLKNRDKEQDESNYLLMKRGHYTVRAKIIKDLMQAVWDTQDLREALNMELTAEEIAKRLLPFWDKYRQDIITYFHWRPNHLSEKPTTLLRWLLSRVGIKVRSRQKMVAGRRFRLYFLDKDNTARVYRYAEWRKKHLQAKDANSNADYSQSWLYKSNTGESKLANLEKSELIQHVLPDFGGGGT